MILNVIRLFFFCNFPSISLQQFSMFLCCCPSSSLLNMNYIHFSYISLLWTVIFIFLYNFLFIILPKLALSILHIWKYAPSTCFVSLHFDIFYSILISKIFSNTFFTSKIIFFVKKIIFRKSLFFLAFLFVVHILWNNVSGVHLFYLGSS